MPCTTCQSKYSFFTHEYECPNCGFSYCRKCLKYKHVLSNGDSTKVCGPCHNKLKMSSGNSATSSSSMSSSELSSAESIKPLFVDLQTQLDTLDNPAKAPIVIYKQERWDRLKTGMDPVDQEIVDRLARLKDKDKKPLPPTTEEIRRRLALLKDQDPDRTVPAKVNYVDKRSDQEKTDDLIREYLEKLELSAATDPDAELKKRLNLLKGVDSSKSSLVNEVDNEDEESLTNNIVAKAMAEAALRAKYQDDDELEEMEVEAPKCDSDEEISCCMCEQTKDLVECTGCTGDLYCPICFEENHDDFERKQHTPKKYT